MSTKNLFLTKGASVSEMVKAMPKQTVKCGFVIDEARNIIEYVGIPKVFKYVIPKMVAIVETLDKKDGFTVIRNKETYISKKDGLVHETSKVTFGYTNIEKAKVLVDNVNRMLDAEYQAYKKANNK
jgi:hypothetical protein